MKITLYTLHLYEVAREEINSPKIKPIEFIDLSKELKELIK